MIFLGEVGMSGVERVREASSTEPLESRRALRRMCCSVYGYKEARMANLYSVESSSVEIRASLEGNAGSAQGGGDNRRRLRETKASMR